MLSAAIEYLVRSPSGLAAYENPLLVRLLAATVSDIVRHRQLSSYPLAIELLEALPELVPACVKGDNVEPLGQLIVDLKSQVCEGACVDVKCEGAWV